jgi:cytosine/adenosine deaminase-related metal-dependent hydrolase
MRVDAFLTNCRLANGRLVDIGIAGGKIAAVGEGAASLSNTAPALDMRGDLVLPGLVDGHMHLDKTLTGMPWMGHAAGPTRMSRIETDKTILPRRTRRQPYSRMRRTWHDAPAHSCRCRSRKRPRETGRGARCARAISGAGHDADRRLPPERRDALPGRSRPA